MPVHYLRRFKTKKISFADPSHQFPNRYLTPINYRDICLSKGELLVFKNMNERLSYLRKKHFFGFVLHGFKLSF